MARIRINEWQMACIIREMMKESVNTQASELKRLFAYLSQKSDSDVRQMLKANDGNTAFEQKAYNYFEPKKIVNDVWVIHFTNMEGYEDIPEHGFNRGTSNYDRLAYTGGGEEGGKINFGFLLDNPYLANYDMGYGDCALVFKTDGVLAYHKIDGDDEVLFFNDNIKSGYHKLIYDEDEGVWYLDENPCGSLRDAIGMIKEKHS